MRKSAPKTAPNCVSKKFYAELMDRLSRSVEAIGADSELHAAMVAMIDAYLADGSIPADGAPMPVRLVFAVMRQEIDKAVSRSRAARERAVKKRAAKCGEVTVDGPVTTETVGGYEAADKAGEHVNGLESPSTVVEIMEGVMTDAVRKITGDESVTCKLNRRQRRETEKLRKQLLREEKRDAERRRR